MLRLIASSALFFIGVSASGQIEMKRHTPRMLAYSNLPEDEKSENVQKNFINQTWRKGKVVFRNATNPVEVPLIFDVYSNRLYYHNNGSIMEFNQPIKEFTIPIFVKADTLQLLYRSTYPAIHKNTEETFYEVLVDGTFQLLRCKAKTIALYKDQDLPEEERNYSKELLYAWLPDGTMVQVKKDKEYLLKEMPKYANAIQRICAERKLKLKNETQLIQLFSALNE